MILYFRVALMKFIKKIYCRYYVMKIIKIIFYAIFLKILF